MFSMSLSFTSIQWAAGKCLTAGSQEEKPYTDNILPGVSTLSLAFITRLGVVRGTQIPLT